MLLKKLALKLSRGNLELFVYSTPSYFPADEQYREVRFLDYSKTWRLGVFVTKSIEKKWEQTVEWDDGRWLYVPDLTDEAILAAMKYLLENENLFQFELCKEPDKTIPAFEMLGSCGESQASTIESRIKLNLLNSFILLKQVVGDISADRMLNEINSRAAIVLNENGWQR